MIYIVAMVAALVCALSLVQWQRQRRRHPQPARGVVSLQTEVLELSGKPQAQHAATSAGGSAGADEPGIYDVVIESVQPNTYLESLQQPAVGPAEPVAATADDEQPPALISTPVEPAPDPQGDPYLEQFFKHHAIPEVSVEDAPAQSTGLAETLDRLSAATDSYFPRPEAECRTAEAPCEEIGGAELFAALPTKAVQPGRYRLVLEAIDVERRNQVVRVLRERGGLDLKEALSSTKKLPRALNADLDREQAQALQGELAAWGARAAIEPLH
ncbi:ribosomal protein L7/L12 [Gloeobacter violaceus]|uniref:Glr3205 protein n=1 Tax=Gloeobacter violaceus (strain ATCC 29082 / PCC 7421) TaxID=251221 RepID=Q7NGG4_GLOVI|nr:ribosomal protein L7/L12 [Gloeobacter violaceus]BAC91146.1 glr3205 [Gloeobacter violaceus PCC 7421]